MSSFDPRTPIEQLGALRSEVSRRVDDMGLRKFARRNQIPISTVRSFMGTRDTKFSNVMAMAKAVGWYFEPPMPPDARPPPDILVPRPSVPVVSMAAHDPRGWAAQEITRINVQPPIDIPDPDAFAVLASGCNMRPAGISPGSICFCSPAMMPATEDIVCVQRRRIADGPVELGIKMLAGQRPENIEVIAYGQIQKHTEGRGYQDIMWDTVPRDEITSIATVVHIARQPNVTV